MTIDRIPDLLTSSLVLGSLYALIALAWVFIFRATRIVNFATGEFVVIGGFLFFELHENAGLPFGVALVLALLFTGAIGAAIHLLLLRPLAGQPPFTPIIFTMGVSIVGVAIISMAWGTVPRSLTSPIEEKAYKLPGDAYITRFGIAIVVATFVGFAAILFFLRRSKHGLQMRAVAEDPLLASQTGININSSAAVAWALAVAAAALTGISFAYLNVVSSTSSAIGIRGLAPALVGGLDSVGGAFIGGYVMALIENASVITWGGEVRDAVAFFVLLVVLMIRPAGLFGTKEIRRV